MILEISKEHHPHGFTVLEMRGSIHTGPDCWRVEHAVEALIRDNKKQIIIDLSQVTHVDSAAIGSLVRCLSQVKKTHGCLRIAGATGMLEHSFQLTKLHNIIELYPTIADATQNAPPQAAHGSDH